jgi:hypothetical protein
MGCWAAGVAMILGWRDHVCISPETIAQNPGGAPYVAQLTTGLDPNDINLLTNWGLTVEAPMCYTAEGFAQLLESYGPLWVASGVGPRVSAHIRVVTGMEVGSTDSNSNAVINDPWELGMAVFRAGNRGSTYTRSFVSLMTQMENLGSNELGEPAPIYVAHLP